MRHTQSVGFAEKVAVLAEAKFGNPFHSYLKKTAPKQPYICADCPRQLKNPPKRREVWVYFDEGLSRTMVVKVLLHQVPRNRDFWLIESVQLSEVISGTSGDGKKTTVENHVKTWSGQEVYNELLIYQKEGIPMHIQYTSPHYQVSIPQ